MRTCPIQCDIKKLTTLLKIFQNRVIRESVCVCVIEREETMDKRGRSNGPLMRKYSSLPFEWDGGKNSTPKVRKLKY